MSEINIRQFKGEDAAQFRALNLAWIEQEFSIEESDLHQLNDPQGNIIDKGGRIAIGELDGQVVATGALMPPHITSPDGRKWLEVVKMATDPAAQGHGIGGSILDFLIADAKHMGAQALWLETNDRLAAATRLYERKGFSKLGSSDLWPTPYARCNLQMVLELHSSR